MTTASAIKAIVFQRENVKALWPEIFPLFEKHWEEVAHHKDIPLAPDYEFYLKADEMGMLRAYTVREDRRYAKAGNMQHGLRIASSELVCCFDADMRCTPDFLLRTVPHILSYDARAGRWGLSQEVGLVQTPQAFYNGSDPLALAMLIDVFSERGYHAAVDIHRIEIPDRIDLATGKVTSRIKKVFRIEIRFQGSEIRRG
jgi:hypothetical protein